MRYAGGDERQLPRNCSLSLFAWMFLTVSPYNLNYGNFALFETSAGPALASGVVGRGHDRRGIHRDHVR
jgi:hypothetical protein